ncbi:MAG TPA: site-2 protease family protein [Pyrinomonadaceae bacterium]|jgi:Zn-dependent protease/predicted transcriptional regulator|nr:site-2 protease family protein [Pyrinomonadaceae bacterium]
MKAQIKLGRIFGVEIGLHYSWFIIALLITFSIADQFRLNNPNWSDSLRWGLALVTAVLFFVSIVVHELSHALVAKARGLPVRAITLFALGGVAQIEKEAADAKTEFWMGIVGPITSFVIGLLCLGITLALGWTPPHFPQQPIPAILMWLGVINIGLAIFNMIPGFPLDGGRVLRGLLWWITGNARRATTIAARVGQVIAFLMILYGVMQFFSGAGINGLWIAFIGWFLLSASRESYAQMMITEGLRGLRVADVMTSEYTAIDGYLNLQTFAEEHLMRSGRRFFVVTINDRPEGIVTPHEINEVPRARWPYTTVADVMRPLDRTRTVGPNTPVTEALEVMASQDLNQLPVVSGGALAGLISRSHILQLIQTRAELHL